jgi:hypothetical protein
MARFIFYHIIFKRRNLYYVKSSVYFLRIVAYASVIKPNIRLCRSELHTYFGFDLSGFQVT